MQWVRYLILASVLLLATVAEAERKRPGRARHSGKGNKKNRDSEMQREAEYPNETKAAEQTYHEAHLRHHRLPAPSPPYCCDQLEIRKNLRIEQIKDRVLRATGLLTPPNMTGVVISQNPNIQGIIESMNTTEPQPTYMQEPPYNDDEPEIKTEKIFSPVEPGNNYTSQSAPPPEIRIPDGVEVLYFKLNQEQLNTRVKRAILHVWLKPITSELDRIVPISVFKVTRPEDPEDYIILHEVTTVSESVDARDGNWVKIGVYKLLQEWLNNPSDNLGLVVTANDSEGRRVAVTNPVENPSNAPLLEIHTEESRRNRNRRNSSRNQCTTSQIESRCCRYPLLVNFVELGWDFIVAPKVYEANFCNGECPYLYAHKYAHSALIQKMNSTNAKHGPCCGARKLSPMKMLYYDHDHKIKFDTIQDMVVDRCGCS
ncbi:growth/differentiation factor 8-like isoform X1 [Penaeus chinensis]|uniref:growth/differentiation factor 8-like isoform X1 n=1 Tax=Penaeus chinensis TaxID=139456 RepID=UPI001FB7D892|nr:growth/differentiation factor 8-like isoform X1 [Penaeus chinensis]